MMRDAELTVFGQHGGDLFTDLDAHTPPSGQRWVALDVLTNAVFASLATDTLRVNGVAGPHTNLSLAAGTYYGRFTALQLTSGTVLAYADRSEANGSGAADYP